MLSRNSTYCGTAIQNLFLELKITKVLLKLRLIIILRVKTLSHKCTFFYFYNSLFQHLCTHESSLEMNCLYLNFFFTMSLVSPSDPINNAASFSQMQNPPACLSFSLSLYQFLVNYCEYHNSHQHQECSN